MSSSPFHHFAFNHGTRKIAPLKVRNPSISPSQIMPSPSGVPFNIADMPWSYNGKPGQLMEFNAVIRPSPILHGPMMHHSLPYPEMRKRKTEPDVVPIPSKQFFTDESMAIHMNNLHLSSEYTSHNIESTTIASAPEDTLCSASASPSSSLDDDMSLGEAGPSTASGSSTHVYMSPQELEERLKKAQRITLCEEVRKLDKCAEILPQVLLERIEKPCTALVLWQPPQVLEKILTNVSTALKEREEQDQQHESTQQRRPNEVAMGEDDEPLPDLPDYDDDLDFEENNNNVATVSDMNSMDVEM